MQEIETLIVNGVKFRLKDTESRREGLTEGSYVFGRTSTAGLMGYFFTKIDPASKKIVLSETQRVPVIGACGEEDKVAGITPDYRVGEKFSLVNGSHYDLCGTIGAVDGNIITYNEESLGFDTISELSALDYDDYTFAVPGQPNVGVIQVAKEAYAFGVDNKATGIGAYVEGRGNRGIGNYCHVEGRDNLAHYGAHAEGRENEALGIYSHTEGQKNKATGLTSHGEGYQTKAEGVYSHSEGSYTKATGEVSHAEGYSCTASGKRSHAEGSGSRAEGEISHAEGNSCRASGLYSHAQGCNSTASGSVAHAEGQNNQAAGECAHAQGKQTQAKGHWSHAEGYGTVAEGNYSHVQGRFNIADQENKYAHIIGNGTGETNRSNAATIDWNGNLWLAGGLILISPNGEKYCITVSDDGILMTAKSNL